MRIPKPSRLAAALAAAHLLAAALPAWANPVNPGVVAGSAAFAQHGKTLAITNSPGTIINWGGFSIRADEITRFIQNGADSAVLNRVTGAESSQLLGQLLSNGRVFLINPNGIAIGAGARIDTAGFIASSLGMSNADFLSGRLRFESAGNPAAVTNHGVIVGNGGLVALIGGEVQNHGSITAGQAALMAGRKVELLDAASPNIRVQVEGTLDTASLNRVLQSGSISAALPGSGDAVGARIEGGRVMLVAAGDVTTTATSAIAAAGATGGNVLAQAHTGTLLVEGRIDAGASSGTGGNVDLLGNRVGVLAGAVVSASGATGGGQIRVGGDYQGANPNVQNAMRATVAADARLEADATAAGDGGRVIVWSDDITRFQGRISARAGLSSGDGGFVEVSGKAALDYRGEVRISAPNGKGGTLLLDPTNINLVAAGGTLDGELAGNADPDLLFADGGANSTLSVGSLTTGFNAGDTIRLEANNNITFGQAVTLQSGVNLSLHASNQIAIGASLDTSGGNLTLISNNGSNVSANVTANALNVTGGFNLSAGTTSISAASNVDSYNQTGGTLTGSGTLNVSAAFAANGSGMTGAGSTVLGNAVALNANGFTVNRDLIANGSISLTPGNTLSISSGKTLTNNGSFSLATAPFQNSIVTGGGTLAIAGGTTATYTSGDSREIIFDNVTVNNSGTFNVSGANNGGLNFINGAVLNNLAGAQLRFTTVNNAVYSTDSTGAAFNNAGQVLNPGNGLATISTSNTTFSAGSNIDAGTGTVRVAGAGTNTVNGPLTTTGAVNFSGTNHSYNGTLTLGGATTLGGTSHVFADGVVVNGAGTLTQDASVTTGNITMNKAYALTSGDTLTISAGKTFSANNGMSFNTVPFQNSTVTGGGTLAIAGSTTATYTSGDSREIIFDNVTVNNSGTFNISGANNGGLNFINGAAFNNLAGAQLRFTTANNAVYSTAGIAGTLTNGGSIANASGGLATISLAVNDADGTWSASTGTLRLTGGGSGTGTMNLGAGTGSLEFAGGNFNLNAISAATGSAIRVNGATTSLAGALAADLVNVDAGTLTLGAASTVARYAQAGGTLAGSGSLSVSNTFAPTAGSMTGAGNIVLGTGVAYTLGGASIAKDLEIQGTVNVGAGDTLALSGGKTLTISGTANWSAGGMGGAIVVAPAGTLNLSGANKEIFGGSLTNAGTINLGLGTGNALVLSAGTVFNNNGGGRVNYNDNNTIDFRSGFGTGTFNNNAGATIAVAAGKSGTLSPEFVNLNGGTIDTSAAGAIFNLAARTTGTMAGTLDFIGSGLRINNLGGNHTVASGTVFNGGFTQTGTTLNFTNATLNGTYNLSGGTWSLGAGTVTLNGTINNSGAIIAGSGPSSILALSSGDALNYSGTSREISALTVNNAGAINLGLNPGSVLQLSNGGVLNNNSGGTVNYNDDNTIDFRSGFGTGTFNNNAGATIAVAAGKSGTLSPEFVNINGGTIDTSAAGAIFNLAARTTGTMAGTLDFIGSGLRINNLGGNHTVASGTVFNGGFTQTGTTLNFTNATLNGTYTLSGGTWALGAGTVTLNGTVNNSGAIIAGSGPTSILALSTGDTLNYSGTTRQISAVTVNNAGTINLGLNAGEALELSNGTILNNNAGGTVSFNATNTIAARSGFGPGTFANNGGTITVAAGSVGTLSTETVTSSGGSVNASATGAALNIQSTTAVWAGTPVQGELRVTSGTLNLTADTSIDSLNLSSATLTGAGNLTLNNAFSQSSGTLSGTGSTTLGSGIAIVANGLTVSRNITSNGLVTLSSGALNINAGFSLGVGGTLDWTGGTLGGTGTLAINSTGTMNINGGGSDLVMSETVINNAGRINWLGASNIRGSFGSTINVQSGGVFDIQRDGGMGVFGGAGGASLNILAGGILRKSAGSGTTTLSGGQGFNVNNAGTVEAQVGTLRTGTSTVGLHVSSGQWNAASGATILLDNITLNTGTSLAGAGTIAIGSGSVSVAGTVNAQTLAQTATSSNLGGTGTLNISERLDWTGSTIGVGTINLASNAVMNINGGGTDLVMSETIVNNSGRINWLGASNLRGSFGSTINVQSGGLFDIQRDGGMSVFGGAGGAFLNVQSGGIVRKSAGAGTTSLAGGQGFTINNAGLIDAQVGTLRTGTSLGQHTSTGQWNAGAGANLLLDAVNLDNGTTLTGAGSIALGSGAVNVTGAGSGTVIAAGATLALNNQTLGGAGRLTNLGSLNISGTSQFNGAALEMSDGTLSIAGGAVFNKDGGAFNWNGGTLAGTGSLAMTNGASFGIAGSGVRVLNGLTINTGGLNLAAGSLTVQSGAFNSAGNTSIGAGTLLDVAGGSFVQSGVLFDVAGTVRMSGGALGANTLALAPGGRLEGTGTLTGNLNNAGGTVAPGASPGLLTVTGNYTQGPAATLAIELAGTTPGTGFDRVAVGGNASLNGTLAVTVPGPFIPATTDTFRFVTAGGTRSGNFSASNLPTGFSGAVIYGTNFADLGFTAVPTVIAPATPTTGSSTNAPTSSSDVLVAINRLSNPGNAEVATGEEIDDAAVLVCR